MLADAVTAIETARLSGLNPAAYRTDILGCIGQQDPKPVDGLPPPDGAARVDATCRDAVFRGADHLVILDAASVELRVLMPNRSDRLPVRPGQPAVVWWYPEDSYILPE